MPGRTLAIGDIHGCDFALETLLTKVPPSHNDTVVVLGDVVDRGPNTKRAIDLLLELQRTCHLMFILGNHEEMMLEAVRTGEWLDDWLGFGGSETLQSYGGEVEDVPRKHLDFLSTGLDYVETEAEIFVHAKLEPGVPLELQAPEWLRWERLTGRERPHESGKRVICGHTSQKSGEPLIFTGWVCIDTWVYGDGCLSALDVGADVLYQSTQAGDFRTRRLRAEG